MTRTEPEAKKLWDIAQQNGKLFSGRNARASISLVPPGWLPILAWALEEFRKTGCRARIAKLTVRGDRLRAVLDPGDDAVTGEPLQELLAESRFYCPTCGKLLDM